MILVSLTKRLLRPITQSVAEARALLAFDPDDLDKAVAEMIQEAEDAHRRNG